MPAVANIVVKKADETTNITYDALTGAAGDGSKAVWRQDTGAAASLPVGMRAMMTMATVSNGPRTARRAVIEFKRPFATLNPSTNRWESSDSVVSRLEVTVPQGIPASEISESVFQYFNLLGAANGLIKQAVVAGFAPQ